jgi:hypothetical protein
MATAVRAGGEGRVANLSGLPQLVLSRAPSVGVGGSLALQTRLDVKTALPGPSESANSRTVFSERSRPGDLRQDQSRQGSRQSGRA